MLSSASTISVSEQQEKSSIYSFLAVVLSSHPTQDHLHALGEMGQMLEIPFAVDFSLDDLDQEYMNLFVVPNPRYVAPYESVYRDRWMPPSPPSDGAKSGTTSLMIKGLVMGESTLKVRQYFFEAGVAPSDDLPDHIANELRLMAYLAARESEVSLEETRALTDLRAKLRQEHLLQWIGLLRERVIESAHLGYYPAALEIAELVLHDDL